DLANCKLIAFPVGIYKAMRSVTEGIHRISLANNELKSLTSRFVTTFSQLRGKGQPHRFATPTSKPPPPPQTQQRAPQAAAEGGTAAPGVGVCSRRRDGRSPGCSLFAEVPVEKLATMASLRSLNLRDNPVGPEARLLVRPLVPFDLLLSPEEPVPKA
ncbi:LRC20 protein, partial [Uria aalge]|nr:LRC20 protein [Uria aalge]